MIVIVIGHWLSWLWPIPITNRSSLHYASQISKTKKKQRNLGERFRFTKPNKTFLLFHTKRNIKISADLPKYRPKYRTKRNFDLFWTDRNETKRNLGKQFRSTKQNYQIFPNFLQNETKDTVIGRKNSVFHLPNVWILINWKK